MSRLEERVREALPGAFENACYPFAAFLATVYVPVHTFLDDWSSVVEEVTDTLPLLGYQTNTRECHAHSIQESTFGRLLLVPIVWSLVFTHLESTSADGRLIPSPKERNAVTRLFAKLAEHPLIPSSVQVALGALAIVAAPVQARLWMELARQAASSRNMSNFLVFFTKAVTEWHPNPSEQ